MIEYENLKATNAAFQREIRAAAMRVIDSGWYVLGQEVAAFEEEFAGYIGSRHCIGVANGLDALTLSFRALELPTDAEVLVASNTYIATILGILQAGLKPVLVEPDLETYNMDPVLIPHAITKRTRAICVTHLYGKPCRMDEIVAAAQAHGLHLVEDCAQSHGARFADKMTGTFGIAGCFSFYPTKNLGALGDAGAVVTDDDDIADRLRYWRNYGSKQKYVNVYPGVNSRLDEIQAAILRAKLPRLDDITARKRCLAEIYNKLLPDWLILPKFEPDTFDVHHIYPVRYRHRDRLREYLHARGIRTEVHYPIAPHNQEALQGRFPARYPITEEIHATVISLPISFATTESEVRQVCDVIGDFLEGPGAVEQS